MSLANAEAAIKSIATNDPSYTDTYARSSATLSCLAARSPKKRSRTALHDLPACVFTCKVSHARSQPTTLCADLYSNQACHFTLHRSGDDFRGNIKRKITLLPKQVEIIAGALAVNTTLKRLKYVKSMSTHSYHGYSCSAADQQLTGIPRTCIQFGGQCDW